uniref:Odorant-binding protein 83cd n=1 Tax=Glossina brevipalpis TaxID=37001 RepID=A0A1A9WTU3_9MUSC
MKLITVIVLSIDILSLIDASPSVQEGIVLDQCLAPYGGYTFETDQRLQRYKQWSPTYEEFPCFTNCYLNHTLNIYNETQGFDKENVIKRFGRSVYDACQEKLTLGNNSCEIAYNGFHCLINHEDDPFILIDNIANITREAKHVMKECLHKFNTDDWQYLSSYTRFPVQEPIPCYTRCFVSKMQLYNYRLKNWNIAAMQRLLGVPAEHANIENCLALSKRRNNFMCAWIYKEMTCFSLAK